MGDKTQLATVALAARYDELTAVVLGTTLGMMVANAPAVWVGEALAGRINMRKTRWVAAALFLLMGVWSLAGVIEFPLIHEHPTPGRKRSNTRASATLPNPVRGRRKYSVRVHG